MNFNIKKFKHLAITKRKNILQTSQYNLNGSRLQMKQRRKILVSTFPQHYHGMIILTLIISKANKVLSLIYRTSTHECDQLTLLTLYKSLVRPQLEYGSSSPYTKGKIMAIEHVQRRATKFILKCDFNNLS